MVVGQSFGEEINQNQKVPGSPTRAREENCVIKAQN